MDNSFKHTRHLWIFFLLSFAITWASWGGILLWTSYTENEAPGWLIILGTLGPLIATIIVAAKEGGKRSLRQVFGLALLWRVNWKWYLTPLYYPILVGIVIVLGVAVWGAGGFQLGDIGRVLLNFLFITILVLVFEEFAWRGYALPRLQNHFSALKSSLLLGFFWAVWHLPLWFIQPERAYGMQFELAMPLFILATVGATLVYTFIFNGTGGSLIVVSLFHGSGNALTAWIDFGDASVVPPAFPMVMLVIAEWTIAMLLVRYFGAAHLSHRKKVTFAPIKSGLDLNEQEEKSTQTEVKKVEEI